MEESKASAKSKDYLVTCISVSKVVDSIQLGNHTQVEQVLGEMAKVRTRCIIVKRTMKRDRTRGQCVWKAARRRERRVGNKGEERDKGNRNVDMKKKGKENGSNRKGIVGESEVGEEIEAKKEWEEERNEDVI